MKKKSINPKRSFESEVVVRHIVGIILAILMVMGGYLLAPQPKEVHSSKAETNILPAPNPAITESTSQAQLLTPVSPVPIPTNSGRSLKIPIIYYHYIGKNPNPSDKLRDNLSVDPEVFDSQMEYIATSGYTPITYDTLYAALKGSATLPQKPIIITFDDGYVDFFVNAFPILRKHHLPSTQFIATGLVDKSYYLHWEQIKEMDKTGLVTFQAHSVAHANLPLMNDDELRNQLVASKKDLEDALGKPVNFMAYPFGVSDPRVWQAAKDAGYFGSAGTWPGDTVSEGNLYNMPRIKIYGGMSLEEFKKKIATQ